MMSAAHRGPVRIGNCSGFLGDRMSAAAELVESGAIDVLTGDWLAELTMLILAKQQGTSGDGPGYARTFLAQMDQVLGACLERGIPVVSNAGGLDPHGCAEALRNLASEAGLAPRIGVVTGDDVRGAVRHRPGDFPNLDTGELLGDTVPLTANAYLGGGPVAALLASGADVVVTGRITDAALVIGPAAWWHGWSFADAAAGDQAALDRFAGALVAGHAIECGAQVTGGNYSWFDDVPVWPAAFPIAEVAEDGSSVITKPVGGGGLVSVGTVTAQLLYEIDTPEYANPDVTARFDTVRLAAVGPDRVAVTGTRGAPGPQRLKVAVTIPGGYRNTMTLVLTGRQARAKADLALRLIAGVTFEEAVGDAAGGRAPLSASDLAATSSLDVEALHVGFDDVAADDPATTAASQSSLRMTVKDHDRQKVGKPFTTSVIESLLACYPGMFPSAPPGPGTAFGVYWPTLIDRSLVDVRASVDGRPVHVSRVPLPVAAATPTTASASDAAPGQSRTRLVGGPADERILAVEAAWAPKPGTWLGDVVGARSGDKGGTANVGLWIPEPGAGPGSGLSEAEVAERYQWLRRWLTPRRVRELVPEAAHLEVAVHQLPNLAAVNVVIRGLLGRGVADSTSLDPQAKGLAEQLRARRIRDPSART